jgi:hypothetical protein
MEQLSVLAMSLYTDRPGRHTLSLNFTITTVLHHYLRSWLRTALMTQIGKAGARHQPVNYVNRKNRIIVGARV